MASSDESGGATRSTRRRGPELEKALRAAVRAELIERGYPDLTFEGVARRAQTSKPVVYRRYPTRAHMVFDAWLKPGPATPPKGTMGSLRTDLLDLVNTFVEHLESIDVDTLRGLIAEVPTEQLRELSDLTSAWVSERMRVVINAACERGELGPHPVSERVSRLPIVLARHELVFTGSLPEGVLIEIVDNIALPLFEAEASHPRTNPA